MAQLEELNRPLNFAALHRSACRAARRLVPYLIPLLAVWACEGSSEGEPEPSAADATVAAASDDDVEDSDSDKSDAAADDAISDDATTDDATTDDDAAADDGKSSDVSSSQLNDAQSEETELSGIGSVGGDAQDVGSVGAGPSPENGQTGSAGGTECSVDKDCQGGDSNLERVLGSIELIDARCDFVDEQNDRLPVCQCRVRMTPEPAPQNEADAGSRTDIDLEEQIQTASEPFEINIYPGHRGFPQRNGCSAFGRTPDCLYCAHEFPGCQVGEADGCDAICADVAAAAHEQYQQKYEPQERAARCSEGGVCKRVIELEGQCYVGGSGALPLNTPGLDCSLSDEELLEKEVNGSTCDASALPACDTAVDCPAALACKNGRCSACDESYSISADGVVDSDGDDACAQGEICVLGLCVLEEKAECRSGDAAGACVLSGVDSITGRGNEETRSYYIPAEPCQELARDQDGNAVMGDSTMIPCD